jgi:hypothetical protein
MNTKGKLFMDRPRKGKKQSPFGNVWVITRESLSYCVNLLREDNASDPSPFKGARASYFGRLSIWEQLSAADSAKTSSITCF